MECRTGCGACCIVVSISSPIPGMPEGKPAGVRCVQLTDDNKCKIFGLPERPKVCSRLKSEPAMCGEKNEDAFKTLTEWEQWTAPSPKISKTS
ncbi:YkgJ family cysteine cluster protein [Neobacillus mesonae]|nr:YkgJ family cysteine cluster protein [Neobacillus mesonae]